MHSWQNGTRCRDDVNVLWSCSYLVFEASIPTCTCFHLENFFVTCFCCFFVLFFKLLLEMVWEERSGKGR